MFTVATKPHPLGVSYRFKEFQVKLIKRACPSRCSTSQLVPLPCVASIMAAHSKVSILL